MNRQMTLVAFLQAQNCSNYPASWRHPDAMHDWSTKEYYQRLGKVLEYGKFHVAFFDDRLAMPDTYGDDFASTVKGGIRAAKLDPVTTAMTVGLATEHLGLGVTYSTTYYEPYHVARMFASMDLMLGGRVAWNVVTSLNDSEAANFGHEEHLNHDERYDRADEFIEVVLGHWDSWADDAIIADRESGVFANPSAVRRIDHKGKYFSSRGPLTVPRSPQGQPVIIQAGQSGRGKEFAGRWGELIFVVYPNLQVGKKSYADMKGYLHSLGRASSAITPAIYPIVAETKTMAEDKAAFIDSLAKPEDGLVLLSEVLNYDFAKKKPGEPFSDEEMESITGIRSTRDRVVQLSGRKNPTVEDFVKFSGRATIREFPLFVGGPKDVADKMEEWFLGEACDGFVIAATNVPGSYEDFVRLVIPELQRRGTFRKDFAGKTLRENLGVPSFIRPPHGNHG